MKKKVVAKKVFIKADETISYANIRVTEIGHTVETENYEYSSNRGKYVLHFVFSGYCSVGNMPATVAPIGFLLTPSEPQRYSVIITPEHTKCEHYWVIFEGKGAKRLLSDAGFPKHSGFFEFEKTSVIKTILDEFFMEYHREINGDFLMLSLLFQLFHINYNSQKMFSDARDRKTEYIEKAVSFIEQNYHKQISTDDIAKTANITPKYMYRLFKRYMNTSPSEFLNRYRIMKAQSLLVRTKKSVSEISALVGYKDVSYFNRVFKKYSSGISPSVFRNQSLSQTGNAKKA